MTERLRTRELLVAYPTGRWPRRGRLDALAGVDLEVHRGRVLGVVGESGSGKTTLLRVLAGLVAPTGGRVELDDTSMWELPARRRRRLLSARIGMVWQDPTSSMNPRLSTAAIVEDPLRIHGRGDRAARAARCSELLELVRLPRRVHGRRIDELSGGQRQRVAVARALALEPHFLLADEPTSALDVSLRGELLDLLAGVRDTLGLGIVLVSHDIQATRYLADEVVIMYLGRIVERGSVGQVVGAPAHPYSLALFSSVSTLSGPRRDRVGQGVPTAQRPAEGCPFAPRCWRTTPGCATAFPAAREPAPGHVHHCLNPPDRDTSPRQEPSVAGT